MDIVNYQHSIHNGADDVRDINFDIYNIPLGLANSLRRVMLSNIPVVAFNDKWEDDLNIRKIVITKNTSGIHNEFLSHRLSMVPICMYKNDMLTVKTYFKNGKRNFVFKNEVDSIPKFRIQIKNDEATRDERDETGMIDVTTDDFQVVMPDDSILDNTHEFFPRSLITNDPIQLDILKPNLVSDEGEEIELVCKPTIGYGEINSCYCPVGTVSMRFIEDEEEAVRIFEQKIQYKNKERLSKQLPEYSDEVVENLKRSFNLLDKQRVFYKDREGNPNKFHFRVESVGFLESDQIVFDSLSIIELKLLDILNCIDVNSSNVDEPLFSLKHDKLSLEKSADQLMGHLFTLNDENHTTANLITDYMKHMYIYGDNYNKILKYVGYKMPHPLKETIEIKLKLNDNLDLKAAYKSCTSSFPNWAIESEPTPSEMEDMLALFTLLNTLTYIIRDIRVLRQKWTDVSHRNINQSSFEITDSHEFLNKYIDATRDFSFGANYNIPRPDNSLGSLNFVQ